LLLTNYQLIHEASHELLHPDVRINDGVGMVLSWLFPVSFTLMKLTHVVHHCCNRSDHEMFDCYYPGDSRLIKWFQWYGLMTGIWWWLVPLGSLLLVVTGLVLGGLDAAGSSLLAAVAALGLLLEGVGLVAHASAMSGAQSEGAASWYEQVTTHGNAYWLRNGLLLASLLLAGWLAFHGEPVWLFALLVPMALASSIIGRALFYVLVIPTTMPGAFFWRNRGFVEHAREVGLAEMPQLGVAYERHHPFRLDELWQTVRETSFRQKVDQLRRIFTG
jgi:hypothetical protein